MSQKSISPSFIVLGTHRKMWPGSNSPLPPQCFHKA